MPPPACDVPNLYEELTGLLRQIPRGRVTTYGDLAVALGSRHVARWVGEFTRDHPHDADCPCHRVVRSTGELGRYITGDVGEKQRKLVAESVEVQDGRVDLDRYRFREFSSSQPLARVFEFQKQIPAHIRLTPFPETPEMVAGLDVSYTRDNRGVAAYALIETATGRLVWSATVERPITFPYIPGLLAFREIPLHLELLEQVRSQGKLAPLILVDGHGLLHHRQAGIATQLGVMADLRTAGVGKKLLCGRVDLEGMQAGESRPVVHAGRVVGTALKATDRSRPVFVSPGQHITVEDAARLVQLLFHGHRLPEPTWQADALSRQAARKEKSS